MQRSIIVFRTERGNWAYVKGVSWGDGHEVKRVRFTMSRDEAITFLPETADHVVQQSNNNGCYAFVIPQHGTLPTAAEVHKMHEARRPQREAAERQLNELMKTIGPFLDRMMV